MGEVLRARGMVLLSLAPAIVQLWELPWQDVVKHGNQAVDLRRRVVVHSADAHDAVFGLEAEGLAQLFLVGRVALNPSYGSARTKPGCVLCKSTI